MMIQLNAQAPGLDARVHSAPHSAYSVTAVFRIDALA
jgi:hypothetical protein